MDHKRRNTTGRRPRLDDAIQNLVGKQVAARLVVPATADVDDDEIEDDPPRGGWIVGILDVRYVKPLRYWRASVRGRSVDITSVVATDELGTPELIIETTTGPIHLHADGTVRHYHVDSDALTIREVVE